MYNKFKDKYKWKEEKMKKIIKNAKTVGTVHTHTHTHK